MLNHNNNQFLCTNGVSFQRTVASSPPGAHSLVPQGVGHAHAWARHAETVLDARLTLRCRRAWLALMARALCGLPVASLRRTGCENFVGARKRRDCCRRRSSAWTATTPRPNSTNGHWSAMADARCHAERRRVRTMAARCAGQRRRASGAPSQTRPATLDQRAPARGKQGAPRQGRVG